MNSKIIARWNDWTDQSIEHLVLQEGSSEVVADAAIIAATTDRPFAVRYRIVCDSAWRVREVAIAPIGEDRSLQLTSDGVGSWLEGSGTPRPDLQGAIDIDISITPFTNTLPIRRLGLKAGESSELTAVYIQLPSLVITTDRQRYTCLETGRRYKYESVDSDFTREIDVDDHGLVVTYPGLFRRTL